LRMTESWPTFRSGAGGEVAEGRRAPPLPRDLRKNIILKELQGTKGKECDSMGVIREVVSEEWRGARGGTPTPGCF
jgi:hypothetical protein